MDRAKLGITGKNNNSGRDKGDKDIEIEMQTKIQQMDQEDILLFLFLCDSRIYLHHLE